MNNHPHIKQTADEDTIARIQAAASSVVPREEALRAALERIPSGAVESPYAPRRSAFGFGKMAIALFAVLLMAVGGSALYVHTKNQSQPAEQTQTVAMTATLPTAITDDPSDAGLDQDAQAIDAQMQALDTDMTAAGAGTPASI